MKYYLKLLAECAPNDVPPGKAASIPVYVAIEKANGSWEDDMDCRRKAIDYGRRLAEKYINGRWNAETPVKSITGVLKKHIRQVEVVGIVEVSQFVYDMGVHDNSLQLTIHENGKIIDRIHKIAK